MTGDRIAFTLWQNSSPDVYKMDPQGGSLVSLTPSAPAFDMSPVWSWDNLRIAMTRFRSLFEELLEGETVEAGSRR